MVLGCFQSVAIISKASVATHALATGGSGGGLCSEWPEGGDAADPLGEEGERQGGGFGATSSPATGMRERRGRCDRQGEHESSHISPACRWGPRQVTLERPEVSFRGVRSGPSSCKEVLTPADAATLAQQLAMLAAVELAAFSNIPHDLQPLRAQAGRASSSLLSRSSILQAAHAVGLRERLVLLRNMLDRIVEGPRQDEKVREYKATMMAWWRGSSYTPMQIAA
ncbi:hypothetical protein Esti_000988 [Eimeria stiedai]